MPDVRARRGHGRGGPRPVRGRRSRTCARAASAPRWRPSADKFGKQIRYADRRGIPFVWFPDTDDGHAVKDIRSGEQVAADPTSWNPPPRRPHPHGRPDQQRRGDPPVIRTHTAGSLRASDVGETVTLAGWVARRRDHGGVAFLDLRDASGVVQVVVRDPEVAHPLRSEFCVKVTGVVSARPEGNANAELPTGEIEVVTSELEVLSVSAPLPFPIDEHVEVGEEARLRHRYLDLRRPAPGAAIRLRSRVNRVAREVLYEQRLRRDRDAHADPLDARGCSRLPRAGAPAAGQLVRPAAEPAAVQAAAHGRRHGALLPDRPLLPRRGLPRRPAAGVHPARHRDELRRPGRRHRDRRGRRVGAVARDRVRDPAAHRRA